MPCIFCPYLILPQELHFGWKEERPVSRTPCASECEECTFGMVSICSFADIFVSSVRAVHCFHRLEPRFKPCSAPGTSQHRGLWAGEDASTEDDDNDELSFEF